MKTGNRYVEILTTEDHGKQIQFNRPELIVRDSYSTLDDSLNDYSCLLIGPGMSENEWSLSIFEKIIPIINNSTNNIPIVADAGFLNLLAEKIFSYKNWILTPHLGEAAKMLQSTVKSIQDNRISSAIAL